MPRSANRRVRLSLLSLEDRAVPAICSWIYEDDPFDSDDAGLWSDTDNWLGNIVPDADDDVIIIAGGGSGGPGGPGGIGGMPTPTYGSILNDVGDIEINSLMVGGGWNKFFDTTAGSLQINNGGNIQAGEFRFDEGDLILDGGTLYMENVELLDWTDAEESLFPIKEGAEVYVQAGGIDTEVSLEIQSGGTLEFVPVGAELRLDADASVENNGLIRFDANTQAIKVPETYYGFLTGEGRIECLASKTATIEAPTNFGGVIVIEQNAHLKFTGLETYPDDYSLYLYSGRLEFGDTATITATHGWTQTGGTVETSGGIGSRTATILGDTDFYNTSIDMTNGDYRVQFQQTGDAFFDDCSIVMNIDYTGGGTSSGWSATEITFLTDNDLTLNEIAATNRDNSDEFELFTTTGGISGTFATTNLSTLNLSVDQTSTTFTAEVP